MTSPIPSPLSSALDWLLESGNPPVRYWALVDLLGRPEDDPEAAAARAAIPASPWVRALMDGQRPDGGFLARPGKQESAHPYKKWGGAHWRLVSLVELGVGPGEPNALAAAQQVLGWLASEEHRGSIKPVNGRVRAHASQEGNALAACSRLGLGGDPRVRLLASSLVGWQWPDGGWNCHPKPEARHSSFYESLAPLWGLIEFSRLNPGDPLAADCREAAGRAAGLFLRHRLFRRESTGSVIDKAWLKLHYPLYWHYDILQALLVLSRLGPLDDPRLQEALDLLESKRLPDGRWAAEAPYWKPAGQPGQAEVVDWGRSGSNLMITLNALRVLKAAGRN